ncbi:hypothetical protein TH54_03455 [Escherichia coli]|nr:hypothetical protein AAW05_01230 [Escherichia coli]KZO87308.1 hypothetical protein TH54_03455 [Escherichia coli]
MRPDSFSRSPDLPQPTITATERFISLWRNHTNDNQYSADSNKPRACSGDAWWYLQNYFLPEA